METYIYNEQAIKEKVFGFVYGCAMPDAIQQRAFEGDKAWIADVGSAKTRVREYIDKVLCNGFCSQDDHDGYFLEAANDICADINAARPADVTTVFSFGNAQKLINMTVKHTYSFCYHQPALRIGFRFCHCPIDQTMLGKVWDQYNALVGKQACRAVLGTKSAFSKPWGNEGAQEHTQPKLSDFPERYKNFQLAIRDIIGDGDLLPVEFDYLVWK